MRISAMRLFLFVATAPRQFGSVWLVWVEFAESRVVKDEGVKGGGA